MLTFLKIYPYSICLAALLLTTFSPSKALGAVSGLLLLAIGILLSNRSNAARRISLLFGLYVALAIFHHILAPSNILLGSAIFLVTYSQFAVVLLKPTEPLKEHDRRGLVTLLTLTCWTQGSIGILQALRGRTITGSFDRASGDVVSGTIGLTTNNPRGSNVFFAIAMLSVALIILALKPHLGSLFRVLPALLAFVLASVLHLQLVLAIASIVTIVTITVLRFLRAHPLSTTDILVPALLVLVIPAGILVTPRNYGTFDSYVVREFGEINSTTPLATTDSTGSTPSDRFDNHKPSDRFDNHKLKIAVRTLLELPASAPYQPLLGVGAGQFNSRAALISTGTYLQGLAIPDSLAGVSGSSQRHFFPLYESGIPPWAGSAWFPFFSAQSLYAELGIIGLGLAIGISYWILAKLEAARRRHRGVAAAMVLMWLLIGIGFYENYWEWTQSLTVPIFALWIAASRASEFFSASGP